MKTLLCTIGRLENKYIREFVEYYSGIGFSHIELYDNNMPDEEHFEDAIGDYVLGGFVNLVDYRGKRVCQLEAYKECYEKNKNNYDWIAFFDCDEFLTLESGNINDFLGNEMFNNAKMLHINWSCYDDNGLVKYDERPVLTRFTHKFKEGHANSNIHIKTILRGGLEGVNWTTTSHTPIFDTPIKCLNSAGVEVDCNSPYAKPQYENAYIKHFITKTIEEFATNKRKRSYPDSNGAKSNEILNLKYFFDNNEYSEEKEKFWKELFYKKNHIIYMTMICNQQFFKEEEKVVRETWAKDLGDGNGYFTYYGDESIERTTLDEENHVIVTKTKDGLFDTFQKTKEAFKTILEHYDFDYIIRTNTSNYLNVKLLNKLCERIGEDDVWAGEMYVHTDSPQVLYGRGNCLILSKKIIELIVNSNISEASFNRRYADDEIIGFIMQKHYGGESLKHVKSFGQEWINSSKLWPNTDFSFKHLVNYPVIQVKKYIEGKRDDFELDLIRLVYEVFNDRGDVDYDKIADEIIKNSPERSKKVWVMYQERYAILNV